jgi:hypothetical protein
VSEVTQNHFLQLLDAMLHQKDRAERYARLIRWLASMYGDNDPIFPHQNDYGHPLAANIELERTWHEVVRGQSPGQPEEQTTSGMDPEADKTGAYQ